MADDEGTVEGELERIVFSSADGQFFVAVLQSPQEQGEVRVVGDLAGIRPGEQVRLNGRWVDDPRYGRQFRTTSWTQVLPSSPKGIVRYLAGAGIRGIGTGMAERIVEIFQEETLDVIEREPDRLVEVPGIGPARARALAAEFEDRRSSRDALVFLHSHGVGPAMARRIVRTYGDRTITAVRENPYQLARDVTGIGFRSADAIARELGYDLGSIERAVGAILHVLESATDDGHLYLPRSELAERCDRLEVPANVYADALDRLVAEAQVAIEGTGSNAPVYLPAILRAEVEAARRVATLMESPGPTFSIDAEAVARTFEARSGLLLSDGQRQAIARALESKVFVLTGGPGTGKTTLVNALIFMLLERGLRIHLAAPTGRAAKRLEEASGRPARTLHRLLEFNPRTGRFQRDRDNPLSADAVIVDESSMVDLGLFLSLVQALPSRARLYLVGDVDQLPSVGAGDVLRDVIASGVLSVARLTEIFRQAGGSAIVENAHRVNRGLMPRLEDEIGDFFHIDRADGPATAQTILELVSERIPRRFGLDAVSDIQVLAPMYRGQGGVENLNRLLQERLNPLPHSDKPQLVLTSETGAGGAKAERFRVGDKVMQRRNNYDKDVFNGDVGRVTDLDPRAPSLAVDFEGRAVAYEGDEIDELQLAYALSVHKSQGSEYPAVVLSLLKEHYPMLQRNLLYTALTRGKRLVVVVGARRALELAVRNASQRERYSRLAERIREAVVAV